MNLRWYVNRLACMSAPEIGFRLRRVVENRWLALKPPAAYPAAAPDRATALAPIVAPSVDPEPYIRAANSIVSGRQAFLGLDSAPFGPGFGWTRDPKSGISASMTFGRTLDYRNESLVGDIKYLWEPNRHLHIPTLAQAYQLSGDRQYLICLFDHLETWIEQNPYGHGPNWASSLELGIRLINWSVAWRMLGCYGGVANLAAESKFPHEKWLESIYRHMEFISGYYSRHSSANNHLIGEAAGVYIGCLTWPYWTQCDRWEKDAKGILVEECQNQIGKDGVNREQASSYAVFVLDLLFLSAVAGRQSGSEFPKSYWDRLINAARFLVELMDESGVIPQIGDSDDALVIRMTPDAHNLACAWLVYTIGYLCSDADLQCAAGSAGDRALWLLAIAGESLDSRSAAATRSAGIVKRRVSGSFRSFEDGGYHFLFAGGHGRPSVRVLFDAGPLGYLGIAAHGHADALAILLSIDGLEFLIDTGTYAYHTERAWRSYFRGTRAHNTVTVDGMDQSESGGNFMWLRHASASSKGPSIVGADLLVEGEHDGYGRLPDPVRHARTIAMPTSGEGLTVTDRLTCHAYHVAEVWWHFAEECHVSVVNDRVQAARGDIIVEMFTETPGVTIVSRRGAEAPIGGWVSKAFGVKRPTTSVAWILAFEGSSEIRTTFRISEHSA